jgi:RNA polymerase sigma-70 factor (ECF subfamily)
MPINYNIDISDELIISYLKNQNTKNQGFKILMEKYQEPLYRHIRRMVGNHEDTDDVLQNTLIKVYRHVEGFKGESQLYSWLYRIATNESITFLKKEQKKRNISLGNDQYNIHESTYFDIEKGNLLLAEAIALLPDKQKLVFNKRYYEEMSYLDMSKELTTSVGALKASFHHAVKKIENYIKEKMS